MNQQAIERHGKDGAKVPYEDMYRLFNKRRGLELKAIEEVGAFSMEVYSHILVLERDLGLAYTAPREYINRLIILIEQAHHTMTDTDSFVEDLAMDYMSA